MRNSEALYVYFLYYLGVVLHILLQARGTIRAQSNSIHSFRIWWDFNHRELRIRLLIDGVLWMVWIAGPRFLGEAAAHMIPPVSYAVAPWIGLSVDRFTHSMGFILRFNGSDMGEVAPK
jgi:hypothetical protein